MRRPMALAFLATSLVLSSVAQLVFRFVMQNFESAGGGLQSLLSAVISEAQFGDLLVLAAGMAMYAISMVTWILALVRFNVSQAYPATSISYVAVYFAAILLPGLNETMTSTSLIGVLLIVAGVVLVAQETDAENGHQRPRTD